MGSGRPDSIFKIKNKNIDCRKRFGCLAFYMVIDLHRCRIKEEKEEEFSESNYFT